MVLPGFAISVLIEVLDVVGFGGFLGDAPTLGEAAKDILNTNAIPVLFVAIERRLAARESAPPHLLDRRQDERRSSGR